MPGEFINHDKRAFQRYTCRSALNVFRLPVLLIKVEHTGWLPGLSKSANNPRSQKYREFDFLQRLQPVYRLAIYCLFWHCSAMLSILLSRFALSFPPLSTNTRLSTGVFVNFTHFYEFYAPHCHVSWSDQTDSERTLVYSLSRLKKLLSFLLEY